MRACPGCGASLGHAFAADGSTEELVPGAAICVTCLRLLVVSDDLRLARCSREARLQLSAADQATIDDMTLRAARLRLPPEVADTFQMSQATIERIDDIVAYGLAHPVSSSVGWEEIPQPENRIAELPGGYRCMFAVVLHDGEEIRTLNLRRPGATVPGPVIPLLGELFGFKGDVLSWARPCCAALHRVAAIQRIATWEISSPGGSA